MTLYYNNINICLQSGFHTGPLGQDLTFIEFYEPYLCVTIFLASVPLLWQSIAHQVFWCIFF